MKGIKILNNTRIFDFLFRFNFEDENWKIFFAVKLLQNHCRDEISN